MKPSRVKIRCIPPATRIWIIVPYCFSLGLEESALAVFYALLGMICWGLAPLFGKLGLNGVSVSTALTLRTLIAAMVVTTWAISSRSYVEFTSVPNLFWLFIALEALLATLVGDLAYFAALKYGNVNIVSLIMSCAPIVTILFNYLFLGEIVTARQLVGAALISIGLVFVCSE